MTQVASSPLAAVRDRQRALTCSRSDDRAAASMVAAISAATARAYADAEKYAAAATPVVVVGETGTGKSYLARHIHRCGPRSAAPFVERTAAEIVDGLAAAQLFGYERGAFTGALERTEGLFAEADCGTLLLDDLHRMSHAVQSQLLRALSSGFYRPMRAVRDHPVRCRLIVAITECPDQLMAKDVLLPDLRYRLGRCVVRMPPLAERREEIGPFAEVFLRRCPTDTGLEGGPTRFAPDVVSYLERVSWPGNLRDLKGAVEHAYLQGQRDSEVRLDHFDDGVLCQLRGPAFRRHGDADANRRAVELALQASGGSHVAAARRLGVNRHTVRRYAVADAPLPAAP